MNHNEAIELQAAVKYVLGELSPVQRDEYEDHYIDCPECAKDVHAAAAFADTTRDVFREEAQAEAAAKKADRVGGWWFAWLKPIVAVPAFAVLLLVVAYQNAVTIPRAEKVATRGSAQLFTTSYSLQTANVRGERGERGEEHLGEVKVPVRPNEAFALDFDFTPARAFDNYLCQLQDESGHSLLQVSIPGSSKNKEAHLAIPGGLVHPGKYNLVFTGARSTKGQSAKDEVLRLGFSIEFRP
jgi:hypothetical protein